VVTSKLGRVLAAIRDAELKTRFCGFESVNYKVFVWTLSAVMCALAGALYVPQVGIINPSEMQPSNSIEMAIWVAVGGRGTLVGALVGAWFINGAKSWLTAAIPSSWLYVLGALFVIVTLFLPRGLVGLARVLAGLVSSRRTAAPASPPLRPTARGDGDPSAVSAVNP
jgi:urea transport system permease protein